MTLNRAICLLGLLLALVGGAWLTFAPPVGPAYFVHRMGRLPLRDGARVTSKVTAPRQAHYTLVLSDCPLAYENTDPSLDDPPRYEIQRAWAWTMRVRWSVGDGEVHLRTGLDDRLALGVGIDEVALASIELPTSEVGVEVWIEQVAAKFDQDHTYVELRVDSRDYKNACTRSTASAAWLLIGTALGVLLLLIGLSGRLVNWIARCKMDARTKPEQDHDTRRP